MDLNNNLDPNENIKSLNGFEDIDESKKQEAEQYLQKRMNWSPRNDDEEDLYQMGLQSLLENYI